MAVPLVVSILTKKYAKLLGEFEFAERLTEDAHGLSAIIEATNRCDDCKKEIEEKLAAIETVIWLFDEDWNPAVVRPNYPRKKHQKRGAITRAAYAVMCDSPIPLTIREISRVVVIRLKIESPDEREFKRIDSAIHGSFKGREGRTLRVESYEPQRWSLIPRDQVKAGTKHPLPASENTVRLFPVARKLAS